MQRPPFWQPLSHTAIRDRGKRDSVRITDFALSLILSVSYRNVTTTFCIVFVKQASVRFFMCTDQTVDFCSNITASPHYSLLLLVRSAGKDRSNRPVKSWRKLQMSSLLFLWGLSVKPWPKFCRREEYQTFFWTRVVCAAHKTLMQVTHMCMHSAPPRTQARWLSSFALTLSTVVAGVSFCAQAGVLGAAASVHTPDITGLNCKREERFGSEGPLAAPSQHLHFKQIWILHMLVVYTCLEGSD